MPLAPSTATVLRVLRVVLHVSFAGLLAVGILRTLLTGSPVAAVVVPLALVLATVYLVGTTWENRFSHGLSRRDPRFLARPWLGVITVCWAALSLLSADFSWVVFPLFFLYLLLLPRAWSLVCVTALTGVVAWSQWLHAPPAGFSPAMVIGPVIGAVFAVVVASTYRAMYGDVVRYRRIVMELEATRSELARTERAAGQATERERLARDIHDTLAQGLSSIVLMSRAARSSLGTGDPRRAEERVATIEASAAQNLAEARRFVRDLSSPALEISLANGLRQLCERTTLEARAQGLALRVTFTQDGNGSADPDLQTVVLRAVQSLLANVRAHSRARQAVVSLSWWDSELNVDVVDDGVGFYPEAPPRGRSDSGFGLPALRRRVGAAGGTVSVESAPEDGTAVTVRLPLAGPASRGQEDES